MVEALRAGGVPPEAVGLLHGRGEVLAGDDHLDDLFVKIFNELLAFMMEDSRNIRRATSLISICKHLERIGDHAVNVAEMVIYMVRGTDVRHPRSRAATDS